MSSGFLLLETVPGREAQVMDLLAAVPGVTHRQLLYPAAIAVKIEASGERISPLEQQLQLIEGVISTRLYRAKNT